MKLVLSLLTIVTLISCQKVSNDYQTNKNEQFPADSLQIEEVTKSYHDTSLVNLKELSEGFLYDMKYATTDNFLKEKVYSCDNCLLRYSVAKALIDANSKLLKQKLKIKLFDCFRPVSVQRKMWDIMPDSRYVANPNKSGSIHNRGAAVDLTIVDFSGKELDMGTAFDHFGKEAHHSYYNLPDTVIKNRQLLKQTMELTGFSAISTEWWHYLYGAKTNFKISTTALCQE